MSKWVKCVDGNGHCGVTTTKKYIVYDSEGVFYNIIGDDGDKRLVNKLRFTPCDPPEETTFATDIDVASKQPTPLKPTDPVPEYCYHVTSKAIKHNKCSFVKSRNFEGKDEEYILLDHGGKRNFGDTYASLEDANIVAKQLWGIK